MKINQIYKNTLYLIIIFLSLYLFKYNINIGIFIYPFILYKISKENKLLVSTLLYYIIGLHFFIILYYWGNPVGSKTIIYISFLTGIYFSIIGLITTYVLSINKKDNLIVEIFTIPSIMYIIKLIFFQPITGIKQFLELPFMFETLYQYLGAGGVNFLLMILSIFLGIFLFQKNNKKYLIYWTLIIILLFLVNSIVISNNNFEQNKKIKIGTIQSNFQQEFNWRNKHAFDKIYPFFEGYTKLIAKRGAKIVLWPEYAIPRDISKNYKFKNKIWNLSKTLNITIIFGSYIDEKKYRKDVAYVVTPENGFLNPYTSQKPYKDIENGNKFFTGNESIIYKTKYGNFLILICFEELYHEILYNYNFKDIDYIFILANNQHIHNKLAYETLKWDMQDIASSYNRFLISSPNTGPTVSINNYGNILQELEFDKTGIIVQEVPLGLKPTFYSKYNEIIIQIIVIMFFSYLFYYTFRNNSNKKKI